MVNEEKQNMPPTPPSWLDKDFIQSVLRSGYNDPTVVVTSIDVSMANAAGDGYLSNMFRIVAKLEDSQERRLIAKCQPMGGHREELIHSLDAYSKETLMLSETLPAMHALLEQAKPGEYQPLCARCLYKGKEPVPFIIMEDLRQAGFTLAKRQQGLDLAHSILAIKALARFHASSLALYDKNPEAVTCFECPIREENRSLIASFYENALRSIATVVEKWPGYEKYVSKLKNLSNTIFDRLLQCYIRKDHELNVLTHGDIWTCNMMFKYTDGLPTDIMLVDFQLCYFCSPALDLHYFLYSSPCDDVRDKHMDSLIQEYHTTFTGALSTLNCSRHAITLQQLQKIIKDYYFYGFISTIAVYPIAILEPEDSYDVEESLSEGDESDGNNTKMFENKYYVEAMKRLLPLFDKEGLLD